MKTIYLLISDNEFLQLLIDDLKKYNPQANILHISETKFEEYIKQPFDKFILSNQGLIDRVTELNAGEIKGEIWCVQEGRTTHLAEGEEKISWFPSNMKLRNYVRLGKLALKINRPASNKVSSIQEKDRKTEPEEAKAEPKKQGEQKTKDKENSKKAIVQNTSNGDENRTFHKEEKEVLKPKSMEAEKENKKEQNNNKIESSGPPKSNPSVPSNTQTPSPETTENGPSNKDTSTTEEKTENSHVVRDEPTKEEPLPDSKKEASKHEEIVKDNVSPGIHHEEKVLSAEESRELRKGILNKRSKRGQKIAVWSPYASRMGVSTFIFNFAIFLEKAKVDTNVIEGLRPNEFFKTMLKRYEDMPENWVSFIRYIRNKNSKVESLIWNYQGVTWLPLDDGDWELNWSVSEIDEYIRIGDGFDLSLIDLPAGEMESYTLDTLSIADELWVVLDGSYQQMTAWKQYIQEIAKQQNIKVKLLFFRDFPFVKSDQIAEEIGFPILAKIPDLTEPVYKNYYQKKPLIFYKDASNILEPHFHEIAQTVLGEQYQEAVPSNPLFHLLKRIKSRL
ncbi:hypothetical protein [Halobacillus litoralis]|uniref:Uncharacterized protein n=1 Tax=Halobacillus litoralis TaxID=45668 RepID=A0A410MJF4_9BACI|nr:hypothetical protein [Halobacillus litoralis]QAS54785.1 hypothetical protein HLI_21255 [Halobacillus litoralis]